MVKNQVIISFKAKKLLGVHLVVIITDTCISIVSFINNILRTNEIYHLVPAVSFLKCTYFCEWHMTADFCFKGLETLLGMIIHYAITSKDE